MAHCLTAAAMLGKPVQDGSRDSVRTSGRYTAHTPNFEGGDDRACERQAWVVDERELTPDGGRYTYPFTAQENTKNSTSE